MQVEFIKCSLAELNRDGVYYWAIQDAGCIIKLDACRVGKDLYVRAHFHAPKVYGGGEAITEWCRDILVDRDLLKAVKDAEWVNKKRGSRNASSVRKKN